MIKYLVLVITAVALGNANASIVCKKDGRFWYPESAQAKKITTMLGVKTCNGKRFKAVLKKLNLKSNVVAGKSSMSIDDIVKSFK